MPVNACSKQSARAGREHFISLLRYQRGRGLEMRPPPSDPPPDREGELPPKSNWREGRLSGARSLVGALKRSCPPRTARLLFVGLLPPNCSVPNAGVRAAGASGSKPAGLRIRRGAEVVPDELVAAMEGRWE